MRLEKVINTFILACLLQFGVSAQNDETTEFNSFYDSLSYALGVLNAEDLLKEPRFDALDKELVIDGFHSNLSTTEPTDCEGTIQRFLGPQGMDFDTTYLKEGSKCIGQFISFQFYNQMTQIGEISNLDMDLMKMGFSQAMYEQSVMTALERTLIVTSFGEQLEKKFLTEIEEKDKVFWAKVVQIKGIQEIGETGIYFETIEQGDGGKPTSDSDIEAHYILTNAIGDTLESSYDAGSSLKINLQSVIAGWKEGFPALEKGGKYRLYVPYEKAYKGGNSNFPQGALCFYIEFIDFGPKGSVAKPLPGIKRRKH